MVDIFRTGIENFYIYVSLLIMVALIIEFILSGAYKNDMILLCSFCITAICIGMIVVDRKDEAVIFSTFSSVFLGVYSHLRSVKRSRDA